MAQTKQSNKTTSSKQSAAKKAASKSSSGSAASKAKKQTQAQQATQSAGQAENVVDFGADTVREFVESGAGEAQKVQERAFAFGRDSAENMTKTVEMMTGSLNEWAEFGREGMEAAMEYSNVAAGITRTLSNEWLRYSNEAFSDQVEYAQALVGCRTMNELIELQNQAVESSTERLFDESGKMTELYFQFAEEASEPVQERMVSATERLSKRVFGQS